jgi:hypothetical protein
MYKPRNLDELTDEIKLALVQQGSSLTDISDGSVLTSLIRSVASTHEKQELSLQEIIRSFYLSTATGLDLDRKAEDSGLQRKAGLVASGSILTISQEGAMILPNELILTEPESGIQVVLNIASAFSNVSTNIEIRIEATAVAKGERGNLIEGTRLISPVFPQGEFVVGTHRTTTGKVCGSFSGGRSVESDAEFRQRIILSDTNPLTTTEGSLKSSLLKESVVTWAYIEPKQGLIQAWIDSDSKLSKLELDRLADILSLNKAAGIPLVIYQADRELIDINIFIKPTKFVDLQALTDIVVGLTNTHLQSLIVGAKFNRPDFISKLYQLTGVLEADIILPTEDLIPSNTSVIRAKTILVSYDTI